MASQTRIINHMMASRATDLAEGGRVQEKRPAVREHHLHVLLDAGEALAPHPLQEVANLRTSLTLELAKAQHLLNGDA